MADVTVKVESSNASHAANFILLCSCYNTSSLFIGH